MDSKSIALETELVFVGVNRRVAALRRDNGELVWQWRSPRGSGYVALLLDGPLLLASVDGYTYALEARSGRELWCNKLSGFGTGVPCLATRAGSTSGAVAEQARRRSSSDSSPTAGGGE